MDLIKYLERIKTMDRLIQKKATGSTDEFARKLDVARSTLMEYLEILRQLQAPIAYDRLRQTYYYLFPCKLIIGYETKMLDTSELAKINKRNFEKFCEVLRVR